MCDTLVALPSKTSSGNLIFGKNSDREPLEAQAVAHFPRKFPKEKIVFDLPDAEIEYYPNLFSVEKSNELFQKLKNEIPWQQDNITVFGQTYPQPRLTALYGNDGKTYSYSTIVMQPHKWNPLLMFIKNWTGQRFMLAP